MIKIGVILLVAYACSASALPSCVCTRDYRPVCGSDGKTYANPCLLNCARTANSALTMARPGPCDQDPTSCLCTFEFKPVCGSDGTTYPNQCSLNCQRTANPILEPRYDGPCRSEKIEEEMPTCVCTRERKPVCGSDGVTYSNACVLKCHAQSKKDLTMKSGGECEEVVKVAELPLPPSCVCARNMQPVCGTDGVTYNNLCLLNCASQNKPLALKSDGPCEEDHSVKVVEQAKPSSCACGRSYMPMCGTDGATYSNPCTMNCAMRKKTTLMIAHAGPCQEELMVDAVDHPVF